MNIAGLNRDLTTACERVDGMGHTASKDQVAGAPVRLGVRCGRPRNSASTDRAAQLDLS
jgi:hypothetical protein